MEANKLTIYQVLFSIKYNNGHTRVVSITQPAATGRDAATKAEQYIKSNWQHLANVQLKHWLIKPSTGIFANQPKPNTQA
jgi:hypothetical protein